MGRSVREMRCVLCATAEEAESFCRNFRTAFDGFAENGIFRAELLLREALSNAVTHGSQADPRKHIFCAIRLGCGRFTIAIHDEGDGFDWRAVRLKPSAPLHTSGRGIDIFRKYATRFRFNAKGNAVTLVLRLPGTSIGENK